MSSIFHFKLAFFKWSVHNPPTEPNKLLKGQKQNISLNQDWKNRLMNKQKEIEKEEKEEK